jgi:hypothetical protein
MITHELELRIRRLQAELTQLVVDGPDDNGVTLRRIVAELEQLENQRRSLRDQSAQPAANMGGTHVGLGA